MSLQSSSPDPSAIPLGSTPWRRFLQSQTVREFVGFIRAMDEAVRGVKVSDECRVSAPVEGLLHALRQLSAWVDEIPPARQAMRYGNPAYRCARLSGLFMQKAQPGLTDVDTKGAACMHTNPQGVGR